MRIPVNAIGSIVFLLSFCSCQDGYSKIKFKVVDFDIENEAVKYCMEKSTATFSKNAGAIDHKFFDQKRDFRPDQPVCKTISFESNKAKKATIIVSTNKKFAKPELNEVVALQNGKGSYTLRNFIPGNTYYYKVKGDDGKILTSGALRATGQVRMIAIDKGFNIRDLGGWKGLGGKTMKYGQLYRGGSLGGTDKKGIESDITADDKAELYRIGIRAQLDLRAKTDAGKYAGESSLHSYSAGKTTMLKSDFNNTMTDYGAYNEDASVIADIAWIIYELKNGKPVYFNCRQGADRTGTIAFIIEGLLGCYDYPNAAGGNQMAIDYELTGFSQANLIDNMKVGSSCRPAQEAYNNTHKLFRKLIDLEPTDSQIKLQNLQQKCYYYLNHGTKTESNKTGISIDKADLDWFIMHMLNLSDKEYAPFRPQWAVSGKNLKEVGESYANVVTYYSGK